METLIQDLRFGLRMLRKNPGFTAVAVLTLALGIGANTAIFSMLNAVVLEHLAIPHAEQLALLHWTATQDPKWGNYMSFSSCEDVLILSAKKGCSFSYPMYQRLSAHLLSVTGLAAYGGPLSFPLSLEGGQTRINAASIFVSGNFFDVMQLPAYRGRNLTASDDIPGAAPVAMLSYPMWARQFGRDPSIVGKTVILMGAQVAIVGISSPDFLGLDRFNPPDLWLPVHTSSALQSSGPFGRGPIWSRPDDPSPWMLLLARLKPGLPLTQAASNLSADFRRALNDDPKHPFSSDAGAQIALTDCSRGLSGFRNRFSDALGVLMAIVACVLLVACANLANLFLARASARRAEIAVRLALGASRGRMLRQLLTESLLIAAAGAIAGFLLALWVSRILAAFVTAGIASPFARTAQIDLHPRPIVFAFTAAIALISAIGFGLAPAFQGSRESPLTAMKASGPGRSGAGASHRGLSGSVLVASQATLAICLLIGAGLFLRTLINLEKLNLGFRPDHILTFMVFPLPPDVAADKAPQLVSDLQKRIAAVPGVHFVTYSNGILLSSSFMMTTITREGDPQPLQTAALRIGPGFFETMQIPLLAGRTITFDDMRPGARICWVNDALADKYFHGQSPIGHRLNGNLVVGLVANAKYQTLTEAFQPILYTIASPSPAAYSIRTSDDPSAVASSVRQAVKELAPALNITAMRTETEIIERQLFNQRLMARLSVAFGLLALLLTCLGVYGVLAYSVARRTSEIAIRMSLGAMPGSVMNLIIRQGLRPMLIGSLIGLAAAAALTRLVTKFLYGVKPLDPVTFFGGAVLLIAVAGFACYIPARRAMRVDPMVSLRHE